MVWNGGAWYLILRDILLMRNDGHQPLSKCLDYCLMETPFYKTLKKKKKDYWFKSSQQIFNKISNLLKKHNQTFHFTIAVQQKVIRIPKRAAKPVENFFKRKSVNNNHKFLKASFSEVNVELSFFICW